MVGSKGVCNDKWKALQEKEVAENMIMNEDYTGARDKLMKAQHHFPLDNIVAMRTVCDILSAASTRFPDSGIDYYWILRLMPTSNASNVRRQYQELVTLLQPLKNNFPGTDSALELIEDAYYVLSDNDKRSVFDSHRNTRWTNYESLALEITDHVPPDCQKVSLANLGKRAEESLLMDMHPTSNDSFGPKLISYQVTSLSSTPMNLEDDVTEVIMDANSSQKQHHIVLKQESSSSFFETLQHKVPGQDFYKFDDDRISNLKTGQIWAVHHSSNNPQNRRYAQIISNNLSTVNVTWLRPVPVSDEERRWCDTGLPVACGSFCLDLEMSEQVTSPMQFSYECSWVSGLTLDQFDIYPKKDEVWAIYDDWNLDEWSYNPDATKSCRYRLVEMLSDFSRYSGANCACLVKVDGFRSIYQTESHEGMPITFRISPGMLYILSHKVPENRLIGREHDGVTSGMLELDQLALPYHLLEQQDDRMISKMKNSDSSSFTSPEENFSQTYPCAEKDLSGINQLLNVMVAGQVWAVYCGRDSIPRQYVLIENVISRTHVSVTFLEPELMTDLEIIWKKKNLPISSGLFRTGGTTVNLETSQISHPVKFQKIMSSYMIYPQKGEIWAMYQEWNSQWDCADHENCQYTILEVLSDFSEGDRLLVARLAEVKGCFTFFYKLKLDGFELIREIPRANILSFSHEIPAFKVPGIGYYGIPESSWHLEPQALPPKRRKIT